MTALRAASFDPVMADANRPGECDRMTLLRAAELDAVITPDEQRRLDAHSQQCPLCQETMLALTEGAITNDKDSTMFANYVGAKTQKRRTWVTALISASVLVHVALVAALLIRSLWVIDMLTPPDRDIALAVEPPPLPPPKATPPKPKVIKTQDKIVKVKPQERVQPVDMRDDEPDDIMVVEDDSCDGCIDGGDPNADPTIAGPVITAPLPRGKITVEPPQPPKVQKPTTQPQAAVQALRIHGDSQIVPDDATKLQIKRDGNTQVVATVKMCVSATGRVTSTQFIKRSSYPAYDQRIASAMRQWRYNPFLVNNKPVPVCTAVTFIYRQQG